MTKQILILWLFITVAITCYALAQEQKAKSRPPLKQPSEITAEEAVAKFKDKVVVMDTNMGRIVFEFSPKQAPNTVNNFAYLVEKGFYEGMAFHRVIKGFMIQGGDPLSTGSGGPGYNIKAEYSDLKHQPGAVACASTEAGGPYVSGSQFYICAGTPSYLDGKYVVFGQVTEGLDVVKAINEVPTTQQNRPIERVYIKTVSILDKSAVGAPSSK